MCEVELMTELSIRADAWLFALIVRCLIGRMRCFVMVKQGLDGLIFLCDEIFLRKKVQNVLVCRKRFVTLHPQTGRNCSENASSCSEN